jgi:hypothetical protein
MLTLLLTVVCFFLIVALVIGWVEVNGGYLGDSSMVPGWLLFGVFVLALLIVCGFLSGSIGFWIH